MSNATLGLFVDLEAASYKGKDLSQFLVGGKELVDDEPETIQWYGLKFSETKHAIFDTFPAETGRKAHLNGKVAEALIENANTLLGKDFTISDVEILACMVRPQSVFIEANVGLYVPLVAKPHKAEDLRKFLISALPLVEEEPDTLQWYAFRKSETEFGIFDAAADDSGREAHLNGEVAAALMANAAELLQTPPDIQKCDILASKIIR